MPALTDVLVASVSFLSQDPSVRGMQLVLLGAGVLAVFFVFYTMRDVLLRTRSFLLQIFSIFLVAALPIVGFLLYMLIRPARTIKERELEGMIRDLLEKSEKTDHGHGKKSAKKEAKAQHATPPIIATMTVTPPVDVPLHSTQIA